jgi:YbbR domain-containing protein
MEGKIQMNDLFKKDITVKIISVLIAVIFWLYVSNSSNPFTTKTFTNIPVKIENESYLDQNNYIIKNKYRTSIDVTIRGRQEAIDKMRTSDFEASLDFSQIKSVNDKKLKITGPFCTQKDVNIESVNPPTIDVQLARNKNGTFPVELKSNVTMKPGYVLVKPPTMTPDPYPIFAEESIIDSVDSIKANLEIKNLDRDTTQTVVCTAYNKQGNEISSLSTGLKVDVKLEVAKQVPVSLVTRGRLATDYVETLRVIDPVNILVSGPADALAKLFEIKTEQIDIDKINSNFTTTVSLIVPDGMKLVNSPKEITVNISVEKLVVRDMELVQGDILLLNSINDGSMNYEIKTEKLTIKIKGRQPDVDAVIVDNLKLGVDVSGLAEGTYNLPLNINLPSQVKLMTQANVEVKVTKAPETPPPLVPPVP